MEALELPIGEEEINPKLGFGWFKWYCKKCGDEFEFLDIRDAWKHEQECTGVHSS